MHRFLAAVSSSADPQALLGIAGWVVDITNDLGGLGAASLITLENLFPPLPSEVVPPLAGSTVDTGSANFTLLGATLQCTAGSVVGAWALYGVGALFDREWACKLMGKLPLVKTSDIEKTEALFDRRGTWTVFSGRMVPIFRSLISIPAGVTCMGFQKFTALTTAKSAVWNTILTWAGHVLGSNWTKVEGYVGVLTKVTVIVCLLGGALWVALRIRSNRRKREAMPAEN